MNTPFIIPSQVLSNLMQNTDFLYQNSINDSFMILDSNLDTETGDYYQIGYTVNYRFHGQDALIFMITMMAVNKQENNSYNLKFLPYDNGKYFEITMDDQCNAIEGMTFEQAEAFITENVVPSQRLQILAISQLYEQIVENLI